MRYELWLGIRYLFAKRREKFISIIAFLSIGGVTLGVAALIVVLAVMTGFDREITEKLVGTNAHVVVDAPAGIRDVEQVIARIRPFAHVTGVSPYVAGQAILRLPDQAFGVLVRGIDVAREATVSQFGEYLVFGRLPQAPEEVLIGTELSAFIGVSPGELLNLISSADGKTHTFKVSGLFRSGMYEYDSNLIVIQLGKAQQLYQLADTVTGIGVKLDRLEHAEDLRSVIQEVLGTAFRVRTWMDLNPALFGALRVEKTVMFIILALIIVVAALNILSMLIMMVMEKTKDIGILRALGATRTSVALLFLLQGAVIGLLGTGLGIAGGFALAQNLNDIMQWLEQTFGISLFPPTVYYLDHIPTQINSLDVAYIAGVAFLLTTLAGTYAAFRAARLAPVDALRYE
jgi:lipoprotein-releasing system permease protein